MKKYLLSVTALLVALSAQAAVYTGASAAYMFGDEEMIYLARVGASFGETGGQAHNVELESGYYDINAHDASIEIIPVMVNYRWSFEIAPALSMYVGGGVGASRIEISGWGHSDSDTVPTLQSLLGLEYAFAANFSARLGYRYMWWHDPELIGENWGNVDDSGVELGFTFRF